MTEYAKVYISEQRATREEVPTFLQSLFYQDPTVLLDLSWTDPSLGVTDNGWWPIEDQTPALALYQSYGEEILTPDMVRRVVVLTMPIIDWTPEQIEAYKAPLQDRMWDRIKLERDGYVATNSRSDGGVQVGSYWYHSDLGSRVKWLGLKDSGRDMLAAGGAMTDAIFVDGAAVMWKSMSGDFVPVDVQLAFDVVEAVKVLDKRIFKTAEAHLAAMLAAYDPLAYDYSTGWPLRYIDTLPAVAPAPDEGL